MSRLARVTQSGRSSIPPYYLPSSIFNRPISSSDTLATDQTPAARLANQINYGRQAGYTFQGYTGIGYGNYEWPASIAFNFTKFSVPIHVVDNTTPKQPVGLYYTSGGTYYKYAAGYQNNLQSYLLSVPIPEKSLCPMITGTSPYTDVFADGTDHEIFIWNRDTDEGWEFWAMTNSNANATALTGYTWNAKYAGYIPSVSNFNGVFPDLWGARACSLGAAGGMITLQDLRDVYAGGRINHALCFSNAFNGGSGTQVAPATRSDGVGANNMVNIPAGFPGAGTANPAYGQDVLYEGARFRFPANVDLSGLVDPMSIAIAEAIRDYGLINVDTSGALAFYVEDPRTLGSPYHLQGPDAVDPRTLAWPSGAWYTATVTTNGSTSVLAPLPWTQLQVLTPVSS